MTRGGYEVDLSVVLATRDRARSLARTLEGLAEQQLGRFRWEVIVVDNGSSDSTAAVIQEASSALPVLAAFEPVPGKNRAVNRGLSLASGALILFTDDDVDPAPDWVRRLAEAALRWPEDNIFGGRILPRFPEATPQWMTSDAFPYGRWAFSTYAPRSDEGLTSETPLGPNMAVRARCLAASAFDEGIGPRGVDYAMGSEVELMLRLYRSGELFVYVPDAEVRHMLRPEDVTRSVLLRRAYRCGRGNARLFPGASDFPLFGVPLHQWDRAAKSLIGVLMSPLRSRQDRLINWMTFHQVRGNIQERRMMLARRTRTIRADESRAAFPTAGAVARAVRRRGLLGVLTAPLAWLLRPFVRWDRIQMYECHPAKPGRDASAPPGVTIELFRGSGSIRDVCVLLCRLEVIKPEDVELRLHRGDWVAIATVDSGPVGFAWSSSTEHWVAGIEAPLRLTDGEMVGYDGYVVPGWRGRQVIGALDAAMLRLALELGYQRQWVYASKRDRFAIRSVDSMGKSRAYSATAVTIPILGKRWGPDPVAPPGGQRSRQANGDLAGG